MSLEIIPFKNEHLDAAATLLSKRHQHDRAHEPALPADFCDPNRARSAVETVWHKPYARGVVALREEQVVGYLIGTPENDDYGRSVWMPLAGHALAAKQDADLYRDLYATLSPQWLARGYFEHYALIPASDQAAQEAWFNLSFGKQQTHALRETDTHDLASKQLDKSIQIRRATPADLDALLELSQIVRQYQVGSPVYAFHLPEAGNGARRSYSQILADPEALCWIALQGSRILSFQLYTPAEREADNLLEAEQHVYLNLAATRAEARGQGLGQALTAHGLHWAQEHGAIYCGTDWRATNLSSSRFWPRQGFRPVAYRLYRNVDERILWGHAGQAH